MILDARCWFQQQNNIRSLVSVACCDQCAARALCSIVAGIGSTVKQRNCGWRCCVSLQHMDSMKKCFNTPHDIKRTHTTSPNTNAINQKITEEKKISSSLFPMKIFVSFLSFAFLLLTLGDELAFCRSLKTARNSIHFQSLRRSLIPNMHSNQTHFSSSHSSNKLFSMNFFLSQTIPRSPSAVRRWRFDDIRLNEMVDGAE